MLVWINGPHGVGKTQVAFELRHRSPDVWICDPEHLGFGLRRMLPNGRTRDFRELPVWRESVRVTLEDVLGIWPGTVIVPQTLTDPDVLTDILSPLRGAGHEVHHLSLLATESEIRRRLLRRGETSHSYAATHLGHAVRALEDARFAEHLPTDGRSIGEVAEQVARHVGLTLTTDPDGTLRRGLRRLAVQLRHIRRH